MNISYEKMDLGSLPAEKEIKGSKGLGCFLVFFASAWGGIPTAILIGSLMSGEFKPAMLFILIFTVIGLALFLFGLSQFFIKGKTIITSAEVSYSKKSLFGLKEWTEKLSNYKGVLYRSEYHSGGKNQSSYTVFIVELLHEEKEKIITLYQSRSDGEVRKFWEETARAVGMPALEKGEDGFIERNVEDLDKSVKELVKENKIKVDFDPRSAPPAGLAVELKEDVMCVRLDKKPMPLLAIVFMIAFPSVFIYIGFFRSDASIVFGVVGVVIMLIMLAIIIGSFITQREIQLSQNLVKAFYVTPWGETAGISLNPDEIEQVQIKENEQSRRKEVVLKTDTGAIEIGQSLSPEAQEWLKNCILAVISA